MSLVRLLFAVANSVPVCALLYMNVFEKPLEVYTDASIDSMNAEARAIHKSSTVYISHRPESLSRGRSHALKGSCLANVPRQRLFKWNMIGLPSPSLPASFDYD